MKSFLSIKPGATFFLGSSQTLVYHKDSCSPLSPISSRWHCQVNREEPQALHRDFQELPPETQERPSCGRMG